MLRSFSGFSQKNLFKKKKKTIVKTVVTKPIVLYIYIYRMVEVITKYVILYYYL